MDCILIGPETPCFCQHRYKQHQTDFKEILNTRPILLPCNGKILNYQIYYKDI
jgi:hypothetical protein